MSHGSVPSLSLDCPIDLEEPLADCPLGGGHGDCVRRDRVWSQTSVFEVSGRRGVRFVGSNAILWARLVNQSSQLIGKAIKCSYSESNHLRLRW